MLRGFLLLTILTWHSTEQLRLVVERSINSIILICRNRDDLVINVLQNTSVGFYLNQTDLASRTHLIRSELGLSFQINPELEGNYSCGTSSGTGSSLVTVMSQPPRPLIALPSTDGFLVNSEEVYAVQSSDGAVTIPCPFEPGNLQNCYFGQWTKDNVEIARIGKPDGSCANGGEFTTVNMSKYGIDRERFSLNITSVTAQEDSGQYQCRLKVVNPATITGQTADFRSFSVTLIVDGQPMIIKPPTDVIIGVEQEERRLTETASFECVALGRPAPDINWYYIVVDKDGSLGEPERLMNNERYRIVNDDGVEDPTGRFNSTSILTMSVTESDGGIIRCKAGTFADAHLTVLGEPFIDIIETLKVEIIYDIQVKVRLNHPVMLNIAYQDINSGVQLSRDLQPVESYNDTSEITFRENRRDLPTGCKKCRVIVSFTAQMGSQIKQGLSVTSQDVIDVEARTIQDTIDNLNNLNMVLITTVILGLIIMIIIIASIISRCLIRAHLKQRRSKTNLKKNKKIVLQEVKDINESMTDVENNMNEEIRKGMIKENLGTNDGNFISKRIISKVLKYLLHPSDCSRPNCLCKEVKGEYNALVNELKSDLDYYAPHNSTILTSELLLEAQIEHESMQGQSQIQTVALIQGNDPIQCSAITIEDNDTLSSSCKDSCSSALTFRDQSCIYYPQLSPVSPGPELELSYVDPVDRVTLDSKGGRYTNQDHDICLIVPPGAVPEGQQVTVEIGVSLSCPILFPAGKRPVSAMVSMCVVGNPNYQFLKPVEVRLSQCLDIATKEDVNSLEIEFLKSGHNLFCFHQADGESTFEPGTHSGIITTKHFCCFCIAANKSKADLTKIYYRLVKVVPKSTPSLCWKVRYCITYFLGTCLRALEKQYNSQNYEIQSLRRFKFATNVSSEKPYIKIECKLEGSGWTLGLENSDKIYASDVDFWDIEPSELEEMEAEELYPPRFVIEVCGSQAQSTGRASLDFSGMENEFKSELILDANRGSHQHSVHVAPAFVSLQSHSEPVLPIQSQPDGPSDRDLMNKVGAAIPTKWKLVGLQLGLEHSQLEMIEQKQSCSVLRFCDIFKEWKKRRTSECSWSTVIDALNSQIVGETALADKLKKEMKISSVDSGVNTM